MNKAELIEAITEKVGDKKTASTAVEAVVDAIQRAVAKGEKVVISGFGVFEKVDRGARTARNPATGEPVKVKKTSVPKFRPGQGFKDVVSGAKRLTGPARSASRVAMSAASAPVKVAGRAAGLRSTAAGGKGGGTVKATAAKSTAGGRSAAAGAAGKGTTTRAAGTKAAAKKSAAGTTTAAKRTGRTSTAAKSAAGTTSRATKAGGDAAKAPAKKTAATKTAAKKTADKAGADT